MATPNNKVFKKDRYSRQPMVGDVVALSAISTRDPIHEHRHKFLWKNYTVISVNKSKPEPGLPYHGWYDLVLDMIDPSYSMRRVFEASHRSLPVHLKNQIRIKTCQVKINGHKDKTSSKNDVNYNYTLKDKLNRSLAVFNMELMSAKDDISGKRTVVYDNDKTFWHKLHKNGHIIQWINESHSRPRWKNVTTTFPFDTSQNTIRFKVSIWDIDYLKLKDQYEVRVKA